MFIWFRCYVILTCIDLFRLVIVNRIIKPYHIGLLRILFFLSKSLLTFFYLIYVFFVSIFNSKHKKKPTIKTKTKPKQETKRGKSRKLAETFAFTHHCPLPRRETFEFETVRLPLSLSAVSPRNNRNLIHICAAVATNQPLFCCCFFCCCFALPAQ